MATRSKPIRHQWQQGQAIVLIALAMIALLGFMILAIDGSKYLDQRRVTQNAADAASLAGLYTFRHGPVTTDTGIYTAIQTSAASNGISNTSSNVSAYWVDTNGDYVGSSHNGAGCTSA